METTPSTADPVVADVHTPTGTFPMVLTAPGSDHIQGPIARDGRPYEPDLLEAIGRVVRPGDLVLDVGANIGNHTLWLAHVHGVRVWAFEPNPELTAALERSVALGGLEEQVRVVTGALGAAESVGRLVEVSPDNVGGNQVVDDPAGAVRVVSLASMDVPRVRAIKIDVEGMEMDVLHGARAVIERDRPDVFVEAIDVAAFEDIRIFMALVGYTRVAVYNATPTHHFAPGVDDPEELRELLHRVAAENQELEARWLETRRALSAAWVRSRELGEEIQVKRDKIKQLQQRVRRLRDRARKAEQPTPRASWWQRLRP